MMLQMVEPMWYDGSLVYNSTEMNHIHSLWLQVKCGIKKEWYLQWSEISLIRDKTQHLQWDKCQILVCFFELVQTKWIFEFQLWILLAC